MITNVELTKSEQKKIIINNATVYLERKYNIYLDMCHHKSGKNGEP